MKKELFRKLPKVDKLLLSNSFKKLIEEKGYNIVYESVNEAIDTFRKAIANDSIETFTDEAIIKTAFKNIERKSQTNLRRVINGTGTIIHTNLGRSIFSTKMVENLTDILSGYNNLEYDLSTGQRGTRYSLVEKLICEITGAEAALIVNNNAAAVLLCLDQFGKNKEVIVSRGELVEIGGSFRIPDIMKFSGSALVEVGTTNRTHLYDYEDHITENTSMLLKVHTSNYKISGFTQEISREEIVSLGRKYKIITMEDLGSGVLIDLSKYGLKKEPTILDSLNSGMDLVTFSGDKLLGGPQCGIIIGKKELVDKLKRNQLLRTFRVCKMTIAILEVLLREYKNENYSEIPTLAMLSEPLDNVLERALELQKKLKEIDIHTDIVPSKCMVGGGSLPEEFIDSYALSFNNFNFNSVSLEKKLRENSVPIIGRIQQNQYILDMKTISSKDYPILLKAFEDINNSRSI